MIETFKAFVVDEQDGKVTNQIKNLTIDDLPEGEVLIKVKYSGINYKDALATVANSKIVQSYPMIPGIDLAGVVEKSDTPAFNPGDEVIVTGYDLGTSRFGGFSEYARVKEEQIVQLPKDLTLEESMIYGTAGYTAGLAIEKLEHNGLSVENKEVLVRGATGGVGTLSVMMLNAIGYKVIASTGKDNAEAQLKALGAREVISRITKTDDKPLGSRKWQAVIDPIGGDTLSQLIKHLDYDGSVAVIGMTGGNHFDSSIFPFILRGANIIGIDSVYTEMKVRKHIWRRLARDLKPAQLHDIKQTIKFDDIETHINNVLEHKNSGRIIIDFEA
ncbi:acryloyl-CoA reductase [Staphylococcus gallinarum]|uniref:acrylyl-CoA reductase family protein n=1 Tax=Staphylococcus gallinarum TaxID=1293 RepID=UPI000D1C3E76|nr:acryloyl-CoA reductase [Staphylococcus gallinarum]MBU7217126.1 acryloyl-CoA reductase [Staphylococcus gallinarum]MCD8792657.1 acryloyl-CoA reductase [Staphylococcus gallinarum]MCD8829966.1 acryloyl-CoA reductase [Staphylococcus gallinarum]MCD8918531.1 acryloyl-CoA reductase [Staphylococcus gallinarum]MDN6414414.1 acryloyl-CoA reductase [Staphylococcus gallinarum]